jgi:hypothetical protein
LIILASNINFVRLIRFSPAKEVRRVDQGNNERFPLGAFSLKFLEFLVIRYRCFTNIQFINLIRRRIRKVYSFGIKKSTRIKKRIFLVILRSDGYKYSIGSKRRENGAQTYESVGS